MFIKLCPCASLNEHFFLFGHIYNSDDEAAEDRELGEMEDKEEAEEVSEEEEKEEEEEEVEVANALTTL